MGCGKSQLLSHLLASNNLELNDYKLLDLDIELEKLFGRSIKSWVELNSWEGFRNEEGRLLNTLLDNGPCIIACGGGSLNKDNFAYFQFKSNIVYLKKSFDDCWQVIQGSKERPLVKKGRGFCLELFEEREQIYQRADFTLKSDFKTRFLKLL